MSLLPTFLAAASQHFHKNVPVHQRGKILLRSSVSSWISDIFTLPTDIEFDWEFRNSFYLVNMHSHVASLKLNICCFKNVKSNHMQEDHKIYTHVNSNASHRKDRVGWILFRYISIELRLVQVPLYDVKLDVFQVVATRQQSRVSDPHPLGYCYLQTF